MSDTNAESLIRLPKLPVGMPDLGSLANFGGTPRETCPRTFSESVLCRERLAKQARPQAGLSPRDLRMLLVRPLTGILQSSKRLLLSVPGTWVVGSASPWPMVWEAP